MSTNVFGLGLSRVFLHPPLPSHFRFPSLASASPANFLDSFVVCWFFFFPLRQRTIGSWNGRMGLQSAGIRLYSRKRKSHLPWRVALASGKVPGRISQWLLLSFPYHWQDDFFLHTEPPEIHQNHYLCVSAGLWLYKQIAMTLWVHFSLWGVVLGWQFALWP